MSDVELGGGTAFINVGALVEPRKVIRQNYLCFTIGFLTFL